MAGHEKRVNDDRCSATQSIWADTGGGSPHSFPGLKDELEADVCVLGAGIGGITTAYLLLKQGFSVAVLEARWLASGETQRTSAHLSNALDRGYSELEKLRGAETTRLAAESHAAAIDRIERICQEENIDCEFERVPGYLMPHSPEAAPFISAEFESAGKAGADVRLVDWAPLLSWPVISPCLLYGRQAQFHPVKYLKGLAAAVQRLGGRIFMRTRARHIRKQDPYIVETVSGYAVKARHVVAATNIPFHSRVVLPIKQAAYRTYAIGLDSSRTFIPKALYWDTEDPYHYVRLQKDILIVGGEDHRTGQERDSLHRRFGRLEKWARKLFPAVGKLRWRWSGQVLETLDGLGLIGHFPSSPSGLYVVTGDSGMGLTHGTLGAMLLTDLIAEKSNPWQRIYDPSRKPIRAMLHDMAPEAGKSTLQYADWLQASEVESAYDIHPGAGAVVGQGVSKQAVYREPGGYCRALSAVCPHMGGVVHWNPVEKSWDCPVHGSRFDCRGRVVNGPANENLKPEALAPSERHLAGSP